MQHAITIDTIVDSTGKLIERREHHYLSCVVCKLAREAQAVELRGENTVLEILTSLEEKK